MRKELKKQTASWLSYAPPEATGQVARQIAGARSSVNSTLRESAPELMAMLLGAPQTANHLNTIASA
jgi:hypothetical protein